SAQLLEEYDSVSLLAAAMRIMTGGERKEVKVFLTPEEPIGTSRKKDNGRSRRRPQGGGGARQGKGNYRSGRSNNKFKPYGNRSGRSYHSDEPRQKQSQGRS